MKRPLTDKLAQLNNQFDPLTASQPQSERVRVNNPDGSISWELPGAKQPRAARVPSDSPWHPRNRQQSGPQTLNEALNPQRGRTIATAMAAPVAAPAIVSAAAPALKPLSTLAGAGGSLYGGYQTGDSMRQTYDQWPQLQQWLKSDDPILHDMAQDFLRDRGIQAGTGLATGLGSAWSFGGSAVPKLVGTSLIEGTGISARENLARTEQARGTPAGRADARRTSHDDYADMESFLAPRFDSLNVPPEQRQAYMDRFVDSNIAAHRQVATSIADFEAQQRFGEPADNVWLTFASSPSLELEPNTDPTEALRSTFEDYVGRVTDDPGFMANLAHEVGVRAGQDLPRPASTAQEFLQLAANPVPVPEWLGATGNPYHIPADRAAEAQQFYNYVQAAQTTVRTGMGDTEATRQQLTQTVTQLADQVGERMSSAGIRSTQPDIPTTTDTPAPTQPVPQAAAAADSTGPSATSARLRQLLPLILGAGVAGGGAYLMGRRKREREEQERTERAFSAGF